MLLLSHHAENLTRIISLNSLLEQSVADTYYKEMSTVGEVKMPRECCSHGTAERQRIHNQEDSACPTYNLTIKILRLRNFPFLKRFAFLCHHTFLFIFIMLRNMILGSYVGISYSKLCLHRKQFKSDHLKKYKR